MRGNLVQKIKQNKAFTLMETLIVIAVMVVLLGISVLGIYDFSVTMKMAELDNYAKTIYLEAQNQLIAKKVEGGMPKLAKQFETERVDSSLDVMPQDYILEAGDDWKNLYQISKGDAYSDALISTESFIYAENGDYIIEFNPQTGMVYGVFYWDKDTTLDYEDDIVRLVDRTRQERTSARIGYYGGLTEDVVGGAFVLNQQAEIINREELFIKISYDATPRLLAYYDESLNIEYTISDEHGHTWSGAVHQGNISKVDDIVDVVYTGQRLNVYILLDSLQEGYQLADVVGEDIVWDDTLTVTVTSEYDHGSDYCVETNAEAPLTCNGLFANGTTKTIVDSQLNQTVEVERLRHLRNLDVLGAATVTNIQIKDHIDFNNDEYVWMFEKNAAGTVIGVRVDDRKAGESEANRPMESFSPIRNEVVFQNSNGIVTIDGENSLIQNFVISSTENNVGLFSQLNHVELKNITITDMRVEASGCDYVGSLVGQMNGGSIVNCGVHLSTYQTTNGARRFFSQMAAVSGAYSNEMERRQDYFTVSGHSTVGGLAGALQGVSISDSHGAVNVNASGNYIGGFAGSISGAGNVVRSYSSGDVLGNSYVGGFAGRITDMQIGSGQNGVYSTSDVRAKTYMGGFVGYSQNANYAACTAYGLVMLQNGANNVESANGAGFVAVAAGNNSFDANCSYLEQTDYNYKVAESSVPSQGYNSYVAGTANDLPAGGSYPYDVNLFSTSFPFRAHWTEQQHHYGDWPNQYVINTSLVYYEKYADDRYGFYCITNITGSEKQWLLNTLQDRECIEDGYAILSKYNLESIAYDLQIGSVDKATTAGDSRLLLDGKLAESDGSLVRLVQQKEVAFQACDASGNVYADDNENSDTFKVAGMYLYQLPYELQCTDRSGVDNFYDRLTLDNGVIYDADPYADDVEVVDELTFFYCPHFAKTAVNPNLTSNENLSVKSLDSPEKVAVRSARQLNALGRFSYYWNKRLGYNDSISFVQETDVNFGTYVKMYCGREFNLLAFDQTYSNKPIGEWNGDSSGKGAFMNDYDGQCHKIIDYCVKSDKQYVGLFGEVYKEGGATKSQIQNVVMVVSPKPEDFKPNYDVAGITPMEQNNAGLVLGTFLDYSGASRNDRYRTGVGALVGSDYTVGQTEGEASVFTVKNCAAAGYTVAYELDTVGNRDNTQTNTPQQPLGIAIGGLIGYSRGNIASSSAVNTVKFITEEDYTGNEAALFMGGFAGSLYYGTIQNCYAGGVITVDNGIGSYGNGMYYVMRIRAGGFCPGWLDAPGVTNDNNGEHIRYQDIYAYADVDSSMWDIREESGTSTKFTYFMPVVSRMAVEYKETGALWWKEWKWDTDSDKGSEVRVPGMSYALEDIYNNAYNRQQTAARNYYVKNADNGQTCTWITYDNLSDLDWVLNNTNQIIKEGKGEAYHSYPISTYLQSTAYPFPAVVTDANGKYVHYGDWPGKTETVATQLPAYYEKYTDGTIGYFLMRADGSTEYYMVLPNDTLRVDALPGDEKEIAENGYGFFKMPVSEDQAANQAVIDNATFQTMIKNGEDGGMYYYYFQKVADWTGTGVDVNANDRCEVLDLNFSTIKMSNGEAVSEEANNVKKIYVNPNFACAISLNETDLGTEAIPLQVRTQAQLSSVGNMNEPEVYMKMTHSVAVDESYAPIDVKVSQVFDGGSEAGFVIKNAKISIFQNNTGTIQNVVAVNSQIQTEQNTAMFVHNNAGLIRNAKIEDSTIESTGIVSGFVYNNTGIIEYSGVHAKSSYEGSSIKGARAYGFVVQNDAQTGIIKYCYAVGSVTGVSHAAGFVGENTGNITLSYANAQVNATSASAIAAGFGIEAGTVANAYATGSVMGVEAYGFMQHGTAENCYTISAVDGANEFGFAGVDAIANNCFWGYDVKAEYNTTLIPDINQPPTDAITLRKLMREVEDYESTEAVAVPYSAVLGDRYPYPTVGIAHYGDWKAPTAEIHDRSDNEQGRLDLLNGPNKYAGIFYYERYMDGSYGYYLKGVHTNFGGTLLDLELYALADDEEYVVTSGYGVFYQDTRWDIIWDVDWRNDITDFDANILEDFHIEGMEEAYQFRYLNQDGLKNAFTRTMYYELFINNTITIWGDEIINAKNKE